MSINPIVATIPFDEDGAHHGFLRLPYSRDDSAWGSVMIPITVVRHGQGATALFTGGNHGDEYEGPIALHDLALKLDPREITGRVIILPAMNYPAFQVGKRTSPIDGGNMNRSFPGRANGTVTEKIADYIHQTLLPMANVVVDIHAGGKTLDFLPFAAAHILEDKAQQQQCVRAMLAFNAPYSMMLTEIDNVGMFDTAVEAQGKVFVTTELGGGGTATAHTVAIAKKGLRNILIHADIIKGKPQTSPTIMLTTDDDSFVLCEHDGFVEMMMTLGDPVEKGDCIACIWPPGRTGVAAVPYHASRSGILTARHFPVPIKPGDCLAVIAQVE